LYAETRVLDKWESTSKPDRGIVYVETRGYNQNGETVLTLKRKVLVPKKGVDGGAPG
ncbi:MAG: MaoC family dehydratase, partial [Blastocatellia bacterium]